MTSRRIWWRIGISATVRNKCARAGDEDVGSVRKLLACPTTAGWSWWWSAGARAVFRLGRWESLEPTTRLAAVLLTWATPSWLSTSDDGISETRLSCRSPPGRYQTMVWFLFGFKLKAKRTRSANTKRADGREQKVEAEVRIRRRTRERKKKKQIVGTD